MASAKKLSCVCYGITFFIFLAIVLWGKFGAITGEEMGFSVLCFYLIMPVVSFVTALILGLKDAYMKWVYPVVFGVFAVVIPWIIFGTADMVSLFFSFVPAVIGLGASRLILKLRGRK